MSLAFLPTLNAWLNFLSAVLLCLGYFSIKKNDREGHKKFMLSAFIVSSLFLISYLYYHYHFPAKLFPDLGWIKTFYLVLLFTHIVLAVVMLPFIFISFFHAYKQNFSKHKKIARFALAMWLYVSVTGVIIYLMLYHFFATTSFNWSEFR